MTQWIALLRGINVGGKNKLKMADFRASLEQAGFAEVQTYIQSGNVVFKAQGAKSDIRDNIISVLSDTHGIIANVMILSPDELLAAIADNPYAGGFEKPNWMFVVFLENTPTSPDMDALQNLTTPNERIALDGARFYFYAGDGAGRSKVITNIDRKLGVSATARNWNTVLKLRDMTGETHG